MGRLPICWGNGRPNLLVGPLAPPPRSTWLHSPQLAAVSLISRAAWPCGRHTTTPMSDETPCPTNTRCSNRTNSGPSLIRHQISWAPVVLHGNNQHLCPGRQTVGHSTPSPQMHCPTAPHNRPRSPSRSCKRHGTGNYTVTHIWATPPPPGCSGHMCWEILRLPRHPFKQKIPLAVTPFSHVQYNRNNLNSFPCTNCHPCQRTWQRHTHWGEIQGTSKPAKRLPRDLFLCTPRYRSIFRASRS